MPIRRRASDNKQLLFDPRSSLKDQLAILSFAGLVVLAGSLNPIPSRTRPLNSPAPMVLSPKAWKSRSLPDLRRTEQSHHDQRILRSCPPQSESRRGKPWRLFLFFRGLQPTTTCRQPPGPHPEEHLRVSADASRRMAKTAGLRRGRPSRRLRFAQAPQDEGCESNKRRISFAPVAFVPVSFPSNHVARSARTGRIACGLARSRSSLRG
jgi:hypothetical protein